MNRQYDDIITHVHHVSAKRPPMPLRARAAQFAPFAALTGYEEAVEEAARLTEERREADEQELALLDQKTALLESRLAERPVVTLTCFRPDARKSGGRRETVTGAVVQLSPANRTLTLQDGRTVKFQEILSLESELFAELF